MKIFAFSSFTRTIDDTLPRIWQEKFLACFKMDVKNFRGLEVR